MSFCEWMRQTTKRSLLSVKGRWRGLFSTATTVFLSSRFGQKIDIEGLRRITCALQKTYHMTD
jgi:hypothetical protein